MTQGRPTRWASRAALALLLTTVLLRPATLTEARVLTASHTSRPTSSAARFCSTAAAFAAVATGDVIRIGDFQAWSGGWAGGPLMETATKMAFEDINLDIAVLPGHTMEYVTKDTRCNEGVGVKGLVELLADKNRPVVGILGAGCSGVSGPVAATTHLFNMVSGHARACAGVGWVQWGEGRRRV